MYVDHSHSETQPHPNCDQIHKNQLKLLIMASHTCDHQSITIITLTVYQSASSVASFLDTYIHKYWLALNGYLNG